MTPIVVLLLIVMLTMIHCLKLLKTTRSFSTRVLAVETDKTFVYHPKSDHHINSSLAVDRFGDSSDECDGSSVRVDEIVSTRSSQLLNSIGDSIRTTNTVIEIVVHGEPKTLSRHRVTRRGVMYNPSSKFQKEFRSVCLEHPTFPVEPLEGPLEMAVVFYCKRPQSHYGTGKNADVLKPIYSKSPWLDKKNGGMFS